MSPWLQSHYWSKMSERAIHSYLQKLLLSFNSRCIQVLKEWTEPVCKIPTGKALKVWALKSVFFNGKWWHTLTGNPNNMYFLCFPFALLTTLTNFCKMHNSRKWFEPKKTLTLNLDKPQQWWIIIIISTSYFVRTFLWLLLFLKQNKRRNVIKILLSVDWLFDACSKNTGHPAICSILILWKHSTVQRASHSKAISLHNRHYFGHPWSLKSIIMWWKLANINLCLVDDHWKRVNNRIYTGVFFLSCASRMLQQKLQLAPQ